MLKKNYYLQVNSKLLFTSHDTIELMLVDWLLDTLPLTPNSTPCARLT